MIAFTYHAVLCSLALFIGMLLFYVIGRRMGFTSSTVEYKGDKSSSGLLDGAVFGLMGLLIAFTFHGASSRLDHRRELVMEEANAIGTAYLRLDLLSAESQPALKNLFRNYLDSRIEVYRLLPDLEAAEAELKRTGDLQTLIWSQAVKACETTGSVPATTLLLAALNQMFDTAEYRDSTSRFMHPPMIIFIMLFGLALMSSLLAGYVTGSNQDRNWVHAIGFTVIMSITVYVILDIEYPRAGLIRVDSVDRILMDLREDMK